MFWRATTAGARSGMPLKVHSAATIGAYRITGVELVVISFNVSWKLLLFMMGFLLVNY